MRPIIRTVVLSLAAVGTAALGLAAPAAQASVTSAATPCGYLVCKIAIYKGGGDTKPAEIAVPNSGQVVFAGTPKTISTSGWGDLKFAVPSLQDPAGGCGETPPQCSNWRYVENPTTVDVPPDFLADGQVAHGLAVEYTAAGWGHDASTGVYWPLYLVWTDGCVHLNSDYQWIKENPSTCIAS